MRIVIAATFAATCVLTPASTFAESPDKEQYRYELDVSAAHTEAGAREAYADIRRQAVRFCRFHGRSPRNDYRAESACRERLVNEALEQVGLEQVYSVHHEHQRRRQARR